MRSWWIVVLLLAPAARADAPQFTIDVQCLRPATKIDVVERSCEAGPSAAAATRSAMQRFLKKHADCREAVLLSYSPGCARK